MANRIPEVEMERKMTDIRREHAHLKRDARIEEAKLWDVLFENDRLLKSSICRYSYDDIVDRMILVAKEPEDDEELPYSEC